jgi:hypothetical protein
VSWANAAGAAVSIRPAMPVIRMVLRIMSVLRNLRGRGAACYKPAMFRIVSTAQK